MNNETEKHIDYVYNFQEEWNERCSAFKEFGIEKQPSVLPKAKRIIVLGDIHGDWDMLMKSLKIAKLIPEDFNDWTPGKDIKWIGKETIVVQVGDQVDRCRYAGIACNLKEATNPDEGNDWKILQFFTSLHKSAEKEGGAVYSLMGNHELMNVDGDFRYVSYEGLREFDDNPETGEKIRKNRFKPGGDIANFLACTRQVALIIGSNLFVHAGIVPKIAKKYDIKDLNELMSRYLWGTLKKAKYNEIFNSAETSPLWNRHFGRMGMNSIYEKKYCETYIKALEKFKVGKIYVGHTPMMQNGISGVCDNKVWLTDYGSSKAFDKFDNYEKPSKNETEYHRSDTRKAQVLEIINDGEKINILK